MKTDGFSLRLELREVGYLLFHKKICPVCGGDLIKRRVSELKLGKDIPPSHDWIFGSNQVIRVYNYEFDCLDCGRVFSLHELTHWEER